MPRLVLYTQLGASPDDPPRVATLKDGKVHDITAVDPGITTMRILLSRGREYIDQVVGHALGREGCPVGEVRLMAPIYDPEKVICIGMNYVDHCTEQGLDLPMEPVVFNKFPSSIIAPGDPLLLPPEVKEMDYEVELAVVIGKDGRRIPRAKAMEHVAGYCVAHDVSARDWQFNRNGRQWGMGKFGDCFCPLGPAIVTPDEISDVHKLGLRCRVNGTALQDSSTAQLVHKVDSIIMWCSQLFTLKVGDVILTGTPPGVGFTRKPPIFLKPGDVVEVEIDEIGTVKNTVVAEEVDPASLELVTAQLQDAVRAAGEMQALAKAAAEAMPVDTPPV